MSRLPQWETAFGNWVEQAQRRNFEWGQFDCALMAAEAVEVITGTHPAPELKGSYYSPIGAARVQFSNDGLTGICDARFPRTKSCHRGDLALGRFGRKETLMVDCGKTYLVMGTGRPILVSKSEIDAELKWRID